MSSPVLSVLVTGLREATVRPIAEAPCERVGCGLPARMGPSVGGRHLPLCDEDLRIATTAGWVQAVDRGDVARWNDLKGVRHRPRSVSVR